MSSWLDDVSEAVRDRARRDGGDLEPFISQAGSAGWCQHPVRLRGRTEHLDDGTGEVIGAVDSSSMPDGVLLKACRNRRSSVCAPCAETYRGDARMLVRSGLEGGKGVPASVAGRPAAFVTLTAPSFGLVHRAPRSGHGPCRPGSPKQTCDHGKPTACFEHHRGGDEQLGEALCDKCYLYDHQVIWNGLVTELWRRTTIAVKRELARTAEMTEKDFSPLVRLSYVKVVEYQARGAIHVHAVVRLDGPDGLDDEPPGFVTTEMLVEAVTRAAHSVSVRFPVTLGRRVAPSARWGELLEVSAIADANEARRVAAYAAKYTTKSTHTSGALDRRVTSSEVRALESKGLRPHEANLVRAAWRLGARPQLSSLNLRRHAHDYGYRGNCLTHSRRFSTSFGSLRSARHAHRSGGETNHSSLSAWRYAGRGYARDGDLVIAKAFYQGIDTSRRDRWLESTSVDSDRLFAG